MCLNMWKVDHVYEKLIGGISIGGVGMKKLWYWYILIVELGVGCLWGGI